MNATIPRWRSAVLATTSLFAVGGCYSFAGIQGDPMVGTDVRATVTDEEALKLSSQTGQLSRTFDGRLVGVTDDSVFVSVVTFRAVSEVSGSRQFRQSLVIPRSGLETLETRELSVMRSTLVGALAATGVALVINQVVAGGSRDDIDGPDLPTGALVPIIRIPIGR